MAPPPAVDPAASPARAPRPARRDRPRLRPRRHIAKHQPRLRRRLAPLFRLGAAAKPPALPPDPQVLGLYIAACASGAAGPKACSVSTIERRLSALMWNFAQRGQPMDRKDRHVATVLAGIRRTQGRPPEQKEAILPEDLLAMIATLDLGDLTRPARPGHSADRLRRRPAPLGNRRPRLPPRRTASAAAGSNFSTTDCC